MVLFGGTSVYYRKHSYILWWTKLSVYSFVSVSNNMDYLLYMAVFLPQETEERRKNFFLSYGCFSLRVCLTCVQQSDHLVEKGETNL